jgi:hypothetical protein
MRGGLWACSCLLVVAFPASAEVTSVTISSRAVIADGQAFGARVGGAVVTDGTGAAPDACS